MHELSLCRTIYGIVDRAAKDRTVTDIHLDVGHLRQVIPDTLTYCWGIVTEGTRLDGSRLQITPIPAVIECASCTAHTRMLGVPTMKCGECGGTNVTVISGEEFLIRSVDVKDEG